MIQRNEVKQERVTRLFEALKNTEYGAEISHESMMRLTGFDQKGKDYYELVGAVNDKLTEIGKRLRNIHGVGYKFISPDEYAEESRRQIEYAGKRLNEADKVVTYAPAGKMTQEGLIKFRAFADRFSSLKAHMIGVRKELSVLVNEKPALQLNSGRN